MARGHEQGGPAADEHDDDQEHQYEAGKDIVFEFRNDQADKIALVGCYVYFQAFGHLGPQLIHDGSHLVAYFDDIFAAAFDHCHGHAGLTIDSAFCQWGPLLPSTIRATSRQIHRFAVPA